MSCCRACRRRWQRPVLATVTLRRVAPNRESRKRSDFYPPDVWIDCNLSRAAHVCTLSAGCMPVRTSTWAISTRQTSCAASSSTTVSRAEVSLARHHRLRQPQLTANAGAKHVALQGTAPMCSILYSRRSAWRSAGTNCMDTWRSCCLLVDTQTHRFLFQVATMFHKC